MCVLKEFWTSKMNFIKWKSDPWTLAISSLVTRAAEGGTERHYRWQKLMYTIGTWNIAWERVQCPGMKE